MLRRMELLRDFWIHARDGAMGAVHDFLFDDHDWHVRYMVVDPGNWLPERQVLISPTSISRVGADHRRIEIDLSRQQIKGSPAVDLRRPVSRQMEERIREYYGWPAYWLGQRTLPADSGPRPSGDALRDNPNLRSTREMVGYLLQATDGCYGTLSDLICDDDDWSIRYLVGSTDDHPEKDALIAPDRVQAIRWDRSDIHVALSRDEIRSGPEYDRTNPTPSYEGQLEEYHDRLRGRAESLGPMNGVGDAAGHGEVDGSAI